MSEFSQYQQIDLLVKAVQYGDLDFVQKSIQSYKLSPNTLDASNCSLLHWAAINGRFEIVEFLVNQNANVNICGGDNAETPLQWAVRYQNCAKVVHLLLAEHSNLNHKSIYGYDALYLAVQAGNINVVYMLLNSGADPNTRDLHGDTPLHWQLKNDLSNANKWDMIRLLCKFHADVTFKGKDGNNALHILCNMGSNFDFHGAFYIYCSGGKPLLSAENNDGETPYQLALRSKNMKMLRFLFDAFMFNTLPYCTPNVINALTLISFFIFLYHFGWLYGIGCFIPVFFGTEIFLQTSIISSSCRSTNGFVWGIIVTATCSYYIFLSPYFNPTLDYFIGLTASVIAYTLFKTMITKPSHVEENEFSSESNITKILAAQPIFKTDGSVLGTDFRLCTSCLCDKAIASTHCSKCNMCVVNLDHHCPFVANCVGKGNRRMFLCFTVAASFGCFLMSMLSFWVQHHHFCKDSKGMLFNILSVQSCMFVHNYTLQCITWMTFFTALWIFGLTCSQLFLIAGETTTFEMLKRGNQGKSPFTQRGMKNVLYFIQTGQYFVSESTPPPPPPDSCCNNKNSKCNHHNNNIEPKSGENSGDIENV